MGNFKPQSTHINSRGRNQHRRSIIKGSVGEGGDNQPDDLRRIARALSEAGLLSADASHKDVKTAIHRAIRHVQRTDDPTASGTENACTLIPASDTELAMRRALVEYRFPTAHRSVALSVAPRGARAIMETGISLAKKRLHEDAQINSTPAAFRRAILPPLSPDAFQSNRRLAEVLSRTQIEGVDQLIIETVRCNGKPGFVEVRDFLNVLRSLKPDRAHSLGQNVKRHLRGKSRRRFIKLVQNIPPNEDDFVDGPS